METKPRLLVLIGSGEMAPQMARVHRSVIGRLAGERAHSAAVKAVVVDTPYGFQENADALSADALDFFGRRLGLDVELAALARADLGPVLREAAYARVRAADFVFSGPGSPSYALSQWSATEMPTLFADKVLSGGALVMASAAALTLGRFTAPIYEIYKAGEDPRWVPGLDVLSAVGIDAAVIPHWNNAEGTAHDTRYCFLGKRRFEALERQLPDDVFVLGIDEHTALVVDLDAGVASVRGRGSVTLRKRGSEAVIRSGHDVPLEKLIVRSVVRHVPAHPSPDAPPARESELAARIVGLEQDNAELEKLATLARPLVEELLRLRREARAMRAYEVADQIRDRLAALGIELSDGPDGGTIFRLHD